MQPLTLLQLAEGEHKDAVQNKLVAPLWHTWLFMAFLLVPFAWIPGVANLRTLLKNADRVMIYIVDIEIQWLMIGFVCLGLLITRTSIKSLIGRLWTTAQDVLRDAKLALGFFVISIPITLPFIFLGPAYEGTHYYWPRTSPELVAFLVIALGAGIGEEFIFRGYLQKQFFKLTGSMTVAVILQASLFALAHGYDQTISGIAEKFLFGVLLSLLAMKSGSLLPGMMLHAVQDGLVGILATLFQ